MEVPMRHALHNLPEGLAVGVGFAAPDLGNAVSLMTGIGIQNMPEGLVVAIALVAAGRTRARAFAIALLTGLVEPVGGCSAVRRWGWPACSCPGDSVAPPAPCSL